MGPIQQGINNAISSMGYATAAGKIAKGVNKENKLEKEKIEITNGDDNKPKLFEQQKIDKADDRIKMNQQAKEKIGTKRNVRKQLLEGIASAVKKSVKRGDK